ncbi:MAG TPA: M23 family metallopeptidase [Solirubrobacteraceae bacterium]|jgi:murein DD-endopeptidase MepM/ murein hydrolase activator NlpD
MRHSRRAILGALTSAILPLLAISPQAQALAHEPGGIAAPSEQAAGGSEFGVPTHAASRRPSVAALNAPTAATPGHPPHVTYMVKEKGVASAYVSIAVTNLTTRKLVISAQQGWIHTGKLLSVRWPRSATLAAGVYHVSLNAHDSHGGNLERSAHASGVVTLTVKAAPTPVAPAPAPAPEAGVPTPASTAAEGAVFPVRGTHNFGGPENRFGAAREGHIHQGQDVLTAEGTQVVVPFSGTITTTSFQAGGAGYYAVEHTTMGFDFMFAHCEANSFAVNIGEAVSAGAALCKAGQTGDATAPHLHFEIWVGGWQAKTGHPIDPLPYLEAWEKDGAS